jgi:DNA (cytosine-5)-methyltransferase 1
MKYLSVCAGIEAATCAWHHMGWKPEAFSEIEPFPSAVLAHHYPDTPNLGDMTKYKEWNLGAIDLLVGGTPCQSFSVAGLRKGLADPRGNLALVYLGIADLFKPKWIVWENVPGVLSSNGGRDFGSFLGALAQLGYGFAYRVLDAQWFGVAQRRKRVFVVGYLGDWRPAAAVLFESSSLSGNPKPSREKGEAVANCLTKSPSSHSGANPARGEGNCVVWPANIASTLNASFGNKLGLENQHIQSGAPLFVPAMRPVEVPDVMSTLLSSTAGISRPGNSATEHETYIPMAPIPYDLHQVTAPVNRQARSPGDPCHTLAKQNAHNAGIVSIQGNLIGREAGGPQGVGASDEGVMYTLTKADVHGVAQPVGFDAYNNAVTGDVSKTLDTGQDYHHVPNVMQTMAVRRLTPRECERLQGFRDDYTLIPWRGKEAPDGPRYKALGNSMAVPVMRWIGERINALLPT